MLKLYGFAPLPILEQFSATLNEHTIECLVYVTLSTVQHNLLSKHSTFNLGILHINVNDEPLQINVYGITKPPDPPDI